MEKSSSPWSRTRTMTPLHLQRAQHSPALRHSEQPEYRLLAERFIGALGVDDPLKGLAKR